MYDAVPVVNVGDAFHPELDGSLDGHEEREEESSVGQVVAEAIHEEEKDGDQLRHDCALDELSKDDFSTSMGQSAMFEEKVSEPIEVFHLDVCPC